MADKDQVRPLAPAIHHIDDQALSMELKKNFKHRKCVKCCGCAAAVVVLLGVVAIVLAFTVFRVKDPELKMNSVRIEGLNLGLGTTLLPGANLTVIADVSVKNPNAASFRYDNTTTSLYYDGREVGVALTPAGNARAGKTTAMNVTVKVQVDRVLAVQRLAGDLIGGSLAVSSYTKVSGKVKILNLVKKNVVVKMNCSMNIDTMSQSIKDQSCKRHVSL